AGRAVVCKRQDGDRVAVGERRRNRSTRCDARIAPLEHRRVAALRQLDDDLIVLSVLAIVAHEPRAQPAGLDADDWIGARIERRLFAEHLDADDIFLQLIAAPGERFVRDEGEKPLQAIDRLKRHAAENARELVADRLVGLVSGLDGRCAAGHGCMVFHAHWHSRFGVDWRSRSSRTKATRALSSRTASSDSGSSQPPLALYSRSRGGRRWTRSDARCWQPARPQRRWHPRSACLPSRPNKEALPCPSTKEGRFGSIMRSPGPASPCCSSPAEG